MVRHMFLIFIWNRTIPFLLPLHFNLCGSSNKRWLQKLIDSYLADFVRNVDVEVIYSVESHCTNLSNQQNIQFWSVRNFRFMQFYVSRATLLAQWSLGMLLMQMCTLEQHIYLLVCCALRGSTRLSCVVVCIGVWEHGKLHYTASLYYRLWC